MGPGRVGVTLSPLGAPCARIAAAYHRMMQLNSLRYLLALEREKHFARAAEACHVSQPSLSAGIAALEEQLGRRLVHRDRRFIGLTPEGLAVLPWARQIVAALDGLRQAGDLAPGPLRGELRLGVIPAALPVVGLLAAELRRRFPDVTLSIASLTSREIAHRLQDHLLDAGVTYVAHEPPASVIAIPLYREQSMFVAAAPPDPGADGRVTWEAALAFPLCLLHQGMQNRRILDANLADRGLAARPQATADSYVALLALVRSGAFATIIPDSYAPLLPGWAHMLAFADPVPASAVGMIIPDRSPLTPMAAAALALGKAIETDD